MRKAARRARVALSSLSLVARVLLAAPGRAGAAGPAAGAADTAAPVSAADAAARQHFSAGVAAYDAHPPDYERALAEFRAAYAAKPSAGIKRNIALTLKAQGKNAEAADALEEMLAEDRGELAPGVRAAAEELLGDLARTVGTLRADVHHADPQALAGVQMKVDGRAVPLERLMKGLRVLPGPHVVGGGPRGYAEGEQMVTAAPGEVTKVDLHFLGVLRVVAGTPFAPIVIDGVAMAERGTWRGAVGVGVHEVRVGVPGYVPFEARVNVPLGGEEIVVRADLALFGGVGTMGGAGAIGTWVPGAPAQDGASASPVVVSRRPKVWFLAFGASAVSESVRLSNAFVEGTARPGTRVRVVGEAPGGTFIAEVGRSVGRNFALLVSADVGALAPPDVGGASLVTWSVVPEVRARTQGAVSLFAGLGLGLVGEITNADVGDAHVSGKSVGLAGLSEAGVRFSFPRAWVELGGLVDVHGVQSEFQAGRGVLNVESAASRLGGRLLVGFPL